MGSNLGFADSELVTKSRSIEMAWRAGRKDRPCAPAARAGPGHVRRRSALQPARAPNVTTDAPGGLRCLLCRTSNDRLPAYLR